MIRLLRGDALTVLRSLPAESCHMCVTSPPYFALRDYKTPPGVWGGDPEHAHEWGSAELREFVKSGGPGKQYTNVGSNLGQGSSQRCPCGAWLGSLGLEPHPDLYIEHLVMVFREVWRVLRPDGTLWLNVGDSYAGSGKGPSTSLQADASCIGNGFRPGEFLNPGGRPPKKEGVARNRNGLGPVVGSKPKDLLLIPFRLAIALQADGWYVRSDIAWCKKSCMPESVQDRPTSAWEHVFLLSKQRTYYFDSAAVREGVPAVVEQPDLSDQGLVLGKSGRAGSPPAAGPRPPARIDNGRRLIEYAVRHATSILQRPQFQTQISLPSLDAEEWQQLTNDANRVFVSGAPVVHGAAVGDGAFLKAQIAAKEFLQQLDGLGFALPEADVLGEGLRSREVANAPGVGGDGDAAIGVDHSSQIGKFQRSTLHNQEYTAEATTSRRGLADGSEVGQPAGRMQQRHGDAIEPTTGANLRNFWLLGPEPYAEGHFAVFPTEIPRRAILAGCPEGGTVLDPFAGAGTTGLVADRLGRNAVLIELNPAYADMAERRIAGESPMFAQIEGGASVLPAEPAVVVDKQAALGKRTYTGFNARWNAREKPA